MAMRIGDIRLAVLFGAALLAALSAGCGPGPKTSPFFDRIRLEPMMAHCEKHFEAVEDKGRGGSVTGPESLKGDLWATVLLPPDKIDPLLEDCKAFLLKTARESGATLTAEELPEQMRKPEGKGFAYSYLVGKERQGTIRVTATSTGQRKLALHVFLEEDQAR